MINSINKGKTYKFKTDEGFKIGIFEGKIISYNPKTIIQLRDTKNKSILYNVKMDILKEVLK